MGKNSSINYQVLSCKRGLLTGPQVISPSLKEKLLQASNLAIGEVAGRDSVAAIIKALAQDDIEAVLPTAVYIGTEYGDWQNLSENVTFIQDKVASKYDKKTFDLLVLGCPELWKAINGRFISVLFKKFSFYSPCLGCHLYMHILRVPLAKELNCTKIITGEREEHEGRIKINQVAMAIDAYAEVLNSAGIELLLPIRNAYSDAEIELLVGSDWKADERQLKCVLSGNYRATDGEVRYDVKVLSRYLNEFIIPVGKRLLKAMQERDWSEVDFAKIVGEVIS